MGKPLANRTELINLGKGLFLQGIPLQEVAQQIGVKYHTVYKWKRTQDWQTTKDQVRHELVKRAQPTAAVAITKSLLDQSRQVREALGEALQSQAVAVASTKPGRDLGRQLVRGKVLRESAAAAASVFGWGSEDSSPRISMLVSRANILVGTANACPSVQEDDNSQTVQVPS